jgi:predicted acetyltransferase
MASAGCLIYIFSDDENKLIGQIRIEMMLASSIENALISISVDQKARGRKYASQMISLASSDYKRLYPSTSILAYIFKEHIASVKSFINAGYIMLREEIVKGIPSYILVKN